MDVSGPKVVIGPVIDTPEAICTASPGCRKVKRKILKKEKRRKHRQEVAQRLREQEDALFNDPDEVQKRKLQEEWEAHVLEVARRQHAEEERLWLERERLAEEDAKRRQLFHAMQEAARKKRLEAGVEGPSDLRGHGQDVEAEAAEDELEDGPAEIIWLGNEIIVRKSKVRKSNGTSAEVAVNPVVQAPPQQDLSSNPLYPGDDMVSVTGGGTPHLRLMTQEELLNETKREVKWEDLPVFYSDEGMGCAANN